MFQIKVVEKIKTHILCSVALFVFFGNPTVYEIMLKNTVKPDRPRTTIWRMRTKCWYLRLQIHTQNM